MYHATRRSLVTLVGVALAMLVMVATGCGGSLFSGGTILRRVIVTIPVHSSSPLG
jgi:hypothetical protein